MKNFSKKIATIAAALALVVVLGVSLAACGSKGYEQLSMEEYGANLIKGGYSAEAEYYDNEERAQMLEGLTYEYDTETYKTLEDYRASDEYKNLKSAVEKMQWYLSGSKDVKDESDNTQYYRVTIVAFSNSSSAKACRDYFQASHDKQMAELDKQIEAATSEEDKKALEEQKKEREMVLVLAGKVVLMGDQTSIDAAYGKVNDPVAWPTEETEAA